MQGFVQERGNPARGLGQGLDLESWIQRLGLVEGYVLERRNTRGLVQGLDLERRTPPRGLVRGLDLERRTLPRGLVQGFALLWPRNQ